MHVQLLELVKTPTQDTIRTLTAGESFLRWLQCPVKQYASVQMFRAQNLQKTIKSFRNGAKGPNYYKDYYYNYCLNGTP